MKIKITKDKILHGEYDSFKDEIHITDLPKYLQDGIVIDEGVTFKRIFDILIMNRKIFDVVFAGATHRFPLGIYIEEYLKDDEDNKSLSYLEVSHSTDIWDYDGQRDVTHYHGFYGIKNDHVDEYQKKPHKMSFAIGFTPISNFKGYEIKVNNEIQYRTYSSKTSKYRSVLKGVQEISVFEFYSAILHEISFHGTPDNRDKFVDDLNESVRQIDSGEMETYPMETDENGDMYLLKDGEREYFKDIIKNKE